MGCHYKGELGVIFGTDPNLHLFIAQIYLFKKYRAIGGFSQEDFGEEASQGPPEFYYIMGYALLYIIFQTIVGVFIN